MVGERLLLYLQGKTPPPDEHLSCSKTESRSSGQLAAAGPRAASRGDELHCLRSWGKKWWAATAAGAAGPDCREQGWATQGVDWRHVEVVSGQLMEAEGALCFCVTYLHCPSPRTRHKLNADDTSAAIPGQ